MHCNQNLPMNALTPLDSFEHCVRCGFNYADIIIADDGIRSENEMLEELQQVVFCDLKYIG